MFYFEYDHTDYVTLLHEYAQSMGTTVDKDHVLHFPKEFANGYYKAIILPKGIQAMLLNITFNQDFYINRKKTNEDFFILRFDEIKVKQNLTVRFGKEYFTSTDGKRSTAILTNSLSDFGYIFSKGTSVKAVNILITRSCMENCLGVENATNLISKYLSVKSDSLNFEPIDSEYRRLINEIMHEEQQNNPLKMVVIQNRIMLLLERFFTRLFTKIENVKEDSLFNNREIQLLMLAEAKLVDDITKPAPGVSTLARIAQMSETKFKVRFKKVYGCSPHEYYQKTRMFHARNFLASGKLTVKEVGLNLGFKNLSNFSRTFKNEFGILPSQISEG